MKYWLLVSVFLCGCVNRIPPVHIMHTLPPGAAYPEAICMPIIQYPKWRVWSLSVDNFGGPAVVFPREHLISFCPAGISFIPFSDSVAAAASIQARKGFAGTVLDVIFATAPVGLSVAGVVANSKAALWTAAGIGLVEGIKAALQSQDVNLLQSISLICPQEGLRIEAGKGATCFFIEVTK